MSVDSALAALEPGAVFHERYRVVRRLNAGSMGAIFEVVDVKTNAPRALKVMLASAMGDPDFRARFESEALITGPIDSDHLVRISDAGVDAATDMPFMAMDLLQGEDLADLLGKRGSLPADEAVLYLSQVARALDKTHAAGIVHRDLKPENLFRTQRDDGSPCIKILDFGIAKMTAPGKDAPPTRALGTPFYMSPEQMGGDGAIGPRADLYALGHIAYALLTGEPYWYEQSTGGASTFALVAEILVGVREQASDRALRRKGVLLPPAFDAWFLTITAATPEARFERASSALAALAEALGVRPDGASSRRGESAGPAPAPMPAGPPQVPVGPPPATPPWPAMIPAQAAVRHDAAARPRSATPGVVVVLVIAIPLVLVVLGLVGLVVFNVASGERARPTPGPMSSPLPARPRR
jgi:serine/threonine-protein kinase